MGCVKRKRNRPSFAKDLYHASPLWRRRRAYAESSGASWYILSGKHGLLSPDVWIEPYDVALKHLGTGERQDWSRRVLAEIQARLPMLAGEVVECRAGKDYLEDGLEDGLWKAGAVVRRPLAGMGIGVQLRWYDLRSGASGAGACEHCRFPIPTPSG